MATAEAGMERVHKAQAVTQASCAAAYQEVQTTLAAVETLRARTAVAAKGPLRQHAISETYPLLRTIQLMMCGYNSVFTPAR